jgi:DNA-directed RNA polymerase I subunit RPA12
MSSSSWPFCPQCGSILGPPSGNNDVVRCTSCPFHARFSDMNIEEVLTASAPRVKSAWISDDTVDDQLEKHATIEEPCPKCGNPEQLFYTMQLRSVDEGSTVFYECPKCNHKYSQNN